MQIQDLNFSGKIYKTLFFLCNMFYLVFLPNTQNKYQDNSNLTLYVFLQESTRRRQKYCESQILNEIKSPPQPSSCIQFPNTFYEPYQDSTSPNIFSNSRSSSCYTYTSTTGMEVPDWTLSEEAKADVYYYGFIVLFLLTLVCLALYFL